MEELKKWIVNNLIAIDQSVNAFLGGDPDETISSRAGKSKREGRRWACLLCRFLHWVDKDHCEKSLELDEGKRVTKQTPEKT